MKLRAITTIVVALLLVTAASASATHFRSITSGADCAGFWGTGSVYFAQPTISVEVFYEVTLTQGVTTVKHVTGSFIVYAVSDAFNYTEGWDMDLCGDYTVEGRFWFTDLYGDDSASFTTGFTCDCEEDGGCHYTPGYWKNHAEAWPVTTLTLGGISYNQAQLLAILDLPVRGDATVILAHHLIAAMLNVADGADDSINDEIDDANALLIMYPLYSKPAGEAKDAILEAKNALGAYNEMIVFGCEGYIAPTLGRIMGTAQDPGEKSTWGAIKSIYK